eukprot:CAMPEP_0184499774 /NCGR_PEP_ID=MMETSP0113_2-20130426/42468_1 /TAXON_ID=91329 /ORGANISM="Norrisiella sphaerica, Strain BC52" /LENGTH=94 /DNA_ID=CAMNT_0026887815 /DNA_START=73 /DNA_END=357 /DNA_ORIENTATION=-
MHLIATALYFSLPMKHQEPVSSSVSYLLRPTRAESGTCFVASTRKDHPLGALVNMFQIQSEDTPTLYRICVTLSLTPASSMYSMMEDSGPSSSG